MRILGVTLRDYRGTTDRSVTFAPAGVTVVEGPNEIGKSSIPEAIDHLFDDLDSSTRRDIQAVRPVDRDVGPEVAVEVETGPYAFTYRKRYLRQPITELQVHRPRPEQLTGRAAHDRVQAILAETVDTALWKALRVQQGDLVGQAKLSRGTSLAQALERSGGEVAPAGDEEHSLVEAAHVEYLRFWTETGRRKQDELVLERAIDESAQRITRLETAIRDIEADVEASLELRTESRRLTEQRGELRARVEERQARVDELTALESRVTAAAARHEAARLAVESARAAAEARRSAVAGLEAAVAARDQVQAAIAQDAQRLEEARAAVTATDAALVAARADRDAARARSDAVQARRTRARDTAELADLEDRYARGRAANSAMAAAAADAALPVTAEVLARIRQQQRAVEIARARLDAARPHVRIEAHDAMQATLDGRPLKLWPGEDAERHIERELRLELPGVATVTVTPGEVLDQQAAELGTAEAALSEALAGAGAADLAEAERLQARREDATRTIAEQRRIRDGVLQGTAPKAIAERILALRERLAADVSSPEGETDDDPDAASRAVADLEQAARAAEQGWEAARRTLLEVEVAAGRRDTESRMAGEDVARREGALAEARTAVPDETLAARVAETEVAERDAATELSACRDELARQGPDQARAQLAEAKRALDLLDVETRLVQDRLLEVTTRLRDHGEDGLAEDLADEQTKQDQARAELRRYQARAAARKLLYETLRDERDRARRSYVAPLRDEVERLGRLVFGPGFAVELSDASLEVVSRTLDGRTIPFRSLSVGAQEQIAIIARLACATIVAPDGGVPVILDDALGNSDPKRLAAMGEVLAAAGDQSQIIVLTCQPDRYEHVPGATVVRIG